MLTIQELEALKGLVQINVNINLPKGHHPMAYDQVRLPFSWKDINLPVETLTAATGLAMIVPVDGLTEIRLSGKRYLYLDWEEQPDLVSFIATELQRVDGDINAVNCPSLSLYSVPNLSILAGNFMVQGCAFPEAGVDSMLSMLVNATSDGSTPWAGTANINGGTTAPPSVTGLGYRTTLLGRGATINVNS